MSSLDVDITPPASFNCCHIDAQAEEVTRQYEDLLDLNTRLSGHEDILQGLLHASREPDSIPRVLDELCRRALSVIGSPAAAVAILQRNDPSLEVLSYVSASRTLAVPGQWPLTGSIAEVSFAKNGPPTSRI